MTATASGGGVAFLHRAVLLAGVLALVAGIFGMHIMTGPMSVPSVDTGAAVLQVLEEPAAAPPGRALQGRVAAPEASGALGTTSAPGGSCAGPDGCAMMSGADVVCVAFPGNTSLAARLPDTTPLPASCVATQAHSATTYAYLPGSPSPGKLSVSRT